MAHLTKQKQRLMVRNPSLSPLTNRRSKVTMAKVWVLQLPVFYYTLRSLVIKAQCSHSYNGGIVVSSIATQTRNHGFEHVQHTNGCCHPLQRAMDIYHQEFNRLQQTALAAALRAHQTDGDMPGSISSRGATMATTTMTTTTRWTSRARRTSASAAEQTPPPTAVRTRPSVS